jgi:hypothetical protein
MGSSGNRVKPDTLRLKHQRLGFTHYARPTSPGGPVPAKQTRVTRDSTLNAQQSNLGWNKFVVI